MTDEQEREIATSDMLCDLETKMKHVAILMSKMLEHEEDAVLHAEELLGAASMVRQWSKRLR